MCSRYIILYVLFLIVESIYCDNSRVTNDCKKNITTSSTIRLSSPTRKRKVLSDVNAYLTGDLSEEEQLLDPWAFFKNYELGEFVEGDLRISSENRRTFLKKAKFWKEGIVPFFVNEIIKNDNHALTVLLNAMRTISITTHNCIQFIPIDMNQIRAYPQLPFLNITGDEQGCFADIGQSNFENMQSQINLNINQCFQLPGNSLHELLHILGQTHEHMRPDRDQYIRIVWDNVASGSQSNFEILDFSEVENFNLPYDYESVTHYSRTAFTVDPALATIVPLNKTTTIGQRTHLSEIDKKKLNVQYACPKNRKRYKFVDILKLHNITVNNKTINHTHDVNILDSLSEKNKPSPQQLRQSNIALGVSTSTNKPHSMKFTANEITHLSHVTPSDYQTGFPFCANLIDKLRKNPYTSITINGNPYNQNSYHSLDRQTLIPGNNKYIHPTYPPNNNPYIPYNPYRNFPISSYQMFRYNPTHPFNYIPSTYEPRATSYESLFYKSPMVSYIQPKPNHYEPRYFTQSKPNPFYPAHFNYYKKSNPYEFLKMNPSLNYFPYHYALSDEPENNKEKIPNYEKLLTKFTTLKPVTTTPETSTRMKVRLNQQTQCNTTSKSRMVNPTESILKPNTPPNLFTTFLRLINPLANNIMGFNSSPLILNRIPSIYNQEIKKYENNPLDGLLGTKDPSIPQMAPLSPFYSHSLYSHPSSYQHPRNNVFMEPSKHLGGSIWNRILNRKINHYPINSNDNPIKFTNSEYPSFNTKDDDLEFMETNSGRIPRININYKSPASNDFVDDIRTNFPKAKSYSNRTPINKETYPVLHGNINFIKYIKNKYPSIEQNPETSHFLEPSFVNIDSLELITNNREQNIPTKIKHPSNKTPENDNEEIIQNIKNININEPEIEGTSMELPWKINSPRLDTIPMITNWIGNGKINRIRYIKNRLTPPKQNFENNAQETWNPLKPNSPNWEKISYENNHSLLNRNNYFNQFIGNESPQEKTVTEFDSSNIPLHLRVLTSHLYPETGKNTQDIGNIPYKLSSERDGMSREINEIIKYGYSSTDKKINDIIKIYRIIKNDNPSTEKDFNDIIKMYKLIKNGYSSPKKDMDDIIKMYQIVKNVYPSPNRDIDAIAKVYQILQSAYPSQKNDESNEQNSDQTKLLQSFNYKFIPSNDRPSVETARPLTDTNYFKNCQRFVNSILTPEELIELIKIVIPLINRDGISINKPENYERFFEILNPSILNELLSYKQTDIESTHNNRNIPSIPDYRFIISSNHSPTVPRSYDTVKFIFNPQKINDYMNPNRKTSLNDDGKSPNQEQSQPISQPVTTYYTTSLKNVQHPLPGSNWLEYFIKLCNKNKKEINDLYKSNSPRYE